MASRRDTRWAFLAFATLFVAGCNGGATVGAGPLQGGNATPTPIPGTSTSASPTPTPTSSSNATQSPGSTPTPVQSPTNLAKIACVGTQPYVTGNAPSFTQTGPSGTYSLVPQDANGNAIAATLSFAPSNAAQGATTASTTTSNSFLASDYVVGTAVPFVATGHNANGTAVTQTCNITRVEALYVANRGQNAAANGTNLPSSVTVYPASASGNATPVATISGPNAATIYTGFVAVDKNGYIFASNVGPMPGQTYSPSTSGYVAIYAPNAVGNTAPIGMIANLAKPQGLGFDSVGNLYVMTDSAINEYAPNANGLGGPASPFNTISGAKANLNACYGLTLDASDNIYAACSNLASMFPKGSTGNVAPTIVQPVGNTGSTFSSRSWLGVAVDSGGTMLLPASNQNLNMVDAYSAGSSGTATPAYEVTSTSFSQPIDIVVDPNTNYFVSNVGTNAIVQFAGATTFQAGVAASTLSGSNTKLNEPFGIYVK